MDKHFMDADIGAAHAAVVFAVQVRKRHRRRTPMGSTQRGEDIEVALRRLRTAMAPLRSALGKFPHDPQTEAYLALHERVRQASYEVQRERIKLHKMLTPAQREQIKARLGADD